MAAKPEYGIQGLTRFARELRKVGEELPKSLRDYNIQAAAQVVAAARGEADTAQQSLAARSLRVSKSASFVGLRLGDNRRYAFARGAEWGAKRYHQFPDWRGNQFHGWEGGPGYFLHPAIREVGNEVLQEYWQSIRTLRAQAFPE